MSEKLTTYQGIRIDDTAEWRLVVYISETGMSAYLKNTENPLEPLVTLFDDTWQRNDSLLLQHIETTVYDHPQLLDDFSTDIVICAPKAIWIPENVAENCDDISSLYNKVYKADESDIMSDTVQDMVCLYSLAPGLPAFLRRTLSGARVNCHLPVLVRRFMSRGAEMPRIYADIRAGEADFVTLDDRKMLQSSTQQWHDPMDIAYHIFNLMDVYGLDPQNTQVSLSGLRDTKQSLVKTLREHISYVMLTMMPSAVSKAEMPLPAAIAIARK